MVEKLTGAVLFLALKSCSPLKKPYRLNCLRDLETLQKGSGLVFVKSLLSLLKILQHLWSVKWDMDMVQIWGRWKVSGGTSNNQLFCS